MTDLISRLHSRPDRDAFADVTFILPDGSELKAHKFVLAVASPVFEAQFFGPLAESSNDNPMTVHIKDVDSTAFRRLIDCIYKSSTDFLKTEINIREKFQDYWLLLRAANMYLVPNVISDVSEEYIGERIMDMFFLTKKSKGYVAALDGYDLNEDLSELVDIMNQASEFSIFDKIAETASSCVVSQLPVIMEKHRDLLNKFSENSISCIVKGFQSYAYWKGDVVASLDLASDILKNGFNAPELLQSCVSIIGRMIIGGDTDSWLRDITSNKNVAWIRPKWKKFIQIVRGISWDELQLGEGDGILRIIEHLDEYKEGGRDDGWDVLEGGFLSDFWCNTDWGPWEQDSDKIDIYSDLLKFAHKHGIKVVVEHCRIRLATKILLWTGTDSEEVIANLHKRAVDSDLLKDLVKFSDEIMCKNKN